MQCDIVSNVECGGVVNLQIGTTASLIWEQQPKMFEWNLKERKNVENFYRVLFV